MKNCHVCNQLCNDDAEFCPICGANLLNAPDENDNDGERVEPVLLTTFEDVVSAEIFKDVLTDNMIPYSDSSEDEIKVVFGGGFSATEIYVDKTDFERARELLDEFSASEVSFGDFGETEEI